jgi:hypothetical protein
MRLEPTMICSHQHILVQEFHNVLLALMRSPSEDILYCNRFSVCHEGFSGSSHRMNFRGSPRTQIGMYFEYWDKGRNCGGDQMTREAQVKAAWLLLQEVRLDPRSYTARGRQQVRETARISCSLPADVVKRLDSLGNARSHHVEKALKLYLLLMEENGLFLDGPSTSRKNNSRL